MSECFLYGNKTKLPIKVVGGISEPETPHQNTIWVKTEIRISECIVSFSKPENVEKDGTVWIKHASSSGTKITICKKPQMVLYLTYSQIYSGGEWTKLDAWVYLGNQWAKFSNNVRYLYDADDQCEETTGGWILKNGAHSLCEFGDNGIILNNRAGDARYAHFFTNNKIVHNEYEDTLCLAISRTSAEWQGSTDKVLELGITTNNTSNWSSLIKLVCKNSNIPQDGIVKLDISKVTNPGYVHVYQSNLCGVITSIWIE